MHRRPIFKSGAYTFSISGSAPLVAVLARALVDLRSDAQPAHQWRLTDLANGRCELHIDDAMVFTKIPRASLTSWAVSTLTRRVLDAEPGFVHLHALAVVLDGSSLIAAGASGAGKSTLGAALVQQGACYVTDEAFALDTDAGPEIGIMAAPKPIVVKPHGLEPVAEMLGLEPPDPWGSWAIPASTIGRLAPPGPHPVRTVVSYRRVDGQPTRIEPMHRADSCHELLLDSPDVERFGPAALGVVARLVAGARCWSALGHHAADVAQALLERHAGPIPAAAVDQLPPTDPTSGPGPTRRTELHSVVIDDRAVIMDSAANRLVTLDPPSTAWWRLLDGTDLDTLIDEIAAVNGASIEAVRSIADPILSELAAADLIAHA